MSAARFWLVGASALLLAGCIDNVSVQNRYNQERDECRGQAEERFGEALGDRADQMDDRTRNTELATLFSQCMGSRGWTVATPNKPKPADQVADNKPFPGQTMPPPAQTARVPVPVILAPPPGYAPYGAPPPGYGAAPMMAPLPGAVMMPAPQPGMVAPQPVPMQAMQPAPPAAVQAVPQPAPRVQRAPRRTSPQPSLPTPSPDSAQDVLDRQLSNPTSRP